MSAAPESHPSREELVAFGQGKLDDKAHQRIEQHLEGCDHCCKFLSGIPIGPIAEALRDSDLDELTRQSEMGDIDQQDDLVGETIKYFGEYELLAEIARGGMGVVFKARQSRLNRIVALKMILDRAFARKSDIKRFHVEAEAAAQLQHPNIVPIYEVGEHSGQHYFSMGFVDGESLSSRIARDPLPPSDAARLVELVATAVQYAHEQGVIHRDLKPANILLDKAGQPYVSDFGLAKRLQVESSLTTAGQVMGTPGYMPPEQATGNIELVAESADVYGLGAILYASLTGRPPFQADNPVDTLSQVVEREPVSPRLLNPSVSRDLETICLKCLEKDRRKRYSSAGNLATELRRYLDGRPILARPIGRMARSWRWCCRKPAVAFLVFLLSTSVLAGTAVSTYFAIRENERAKNESTLRGIAETREQEANEAKSTAQQETARTKVALKDAERSAYFNCITATYLEWQANNPLRARELLNSCPDRFQFWSELHNWEWDYLQSLCNAEELTLNGHTDWVMSVAFATDGDHLASCGRDGTVRIWNLAYQQTEFELAAHEGSTTSVAFQPDSHLLATCGHDGFVRLWNASTGELSQELGSHDGQGECVTFSSDGRLLASAARDRSINIWDPDSGELLNSFQQPFAHVYRVAFSPDGNKLAAVAGGSPDIGGKVFVFDTKSGEILQTLHGHTSLTTSVGYSSTGEQIAAGSHDGTVRVWDAASGEETLTFQGHEDYISGLAFSLDGKRIATASSDFQGGGSRGSGEVKIWSTGDGRELLTLRGHTERVRQIAFSPDGTQLATAGYDGTVRVWDSTQQDQSQRLQLANETINDVATHPNQPIAVSTSRRPQVWDLRSTSETARFAGHDDFTYRVAFHPEGELIASCTKRGQVKLWDGQTGEELFSIGGGDAEIEDLCIHPDGKRIVIALNNQSVQMWNVNTNQVERTIRIVDNDVISLAIDPGGEHLAVGLHNGSLQVLSLANGEFLRELTGHRGSIRRLCFSNHGRWLATASLDQTAIIWEWPSGKPLHTLRGHTRNINDLAFNPDDSRLVTASRDETLRLWDTVTGDSVLTLRGHEEGVLSVDFSADGRSIISGGYGGLNFWTANPR